MTGVVVDDAAGSPVQGVLLTSDSGTDYNNIPDVKYDYITPLPEPGGTRRTACWDHCSVVVEEGGPVSRVVGLDPLL